MHHLKGLIQVTLKGERCSIECCPFYPLMELLLPVVWNGGVFFPKALGKTSRANRRCRGEERKSSVSFENLLWRFGEPSGTGRRWYYSKGNWKIELQVQFSVHMNMQLTTQEPLWIQPIFRNRRSESSLTLNLTFYLNNNKYKYHSCQL